MQAFDAGFSRHDMTISVTVIGGRLHFRGLPVTALTDVVAVAVCGLDVVALTGRGRVYEFHVANAWLVQHDPPYQTATFTPERLMRGAGDHTRVTEVALGNGHFIALLVTGEVAGAGVNVFGELAARPTMPATSTGVMVLISTGSLAGVSVASVAAGEHSSGAVDASGRAHFCGGNYAGQLPLGHQQHAHAWQESPFLSDVAMLSIGAHGAATTHDGALWTWGGNWCGQLGHGDNTHRDTPERVGGLADRVRSVVCGASHTLIVSAANTVLSAGDCCDPQVEMGNTVFAVVCGLPAVAQVAVDTLRSAALTLEGEVYEGGWMGGGFSPVPVPRLPHPVALPPTLQCAGVSLAVPPLRTHWEHAHAMVFAMATHKRLGTASVFHGLSDCLLYAIFRQCTGESVSQRRRRGRW